MVWIIAIVLILLMGAVILDVIINKLNPIPRMSNEDNRFIFVDNVKTRKMFECIKR